MKKYLIVIALLFISIVIIAQDAPSGYTNYFGLRMWDEGNYPGADSVNQNLIDIDNIMHVRDQRIDSAKNAISWMFNYPGGTFKRYDSTEFDNDTLKVKSGVFPKLSTANTFTDVNNFSNLRTDFGNGTSGVLNFTVANDAGGIFFKKNNSTNVLKWDEVDGPYWQVLSGMTVAGDLDITGSFKVNGTPISSGGGDAYLTNRQTFTKRNVFTDTLKASGIVLFDSAKVSGSITAGYLKGSGEFITNIVADNIALGSLTDAVLSANIVKYSSFDTAYVAFQNQQNAFTKYNLFSDSVGFSGMARFDSAIVKGMINITGEFRLNTLSGVMTNEEFALRSYPNTFTNENTFMAETYFNGATYFSELATMASDLIVSWVKNQSSVSAYQYEKIKIVASTMPSAVNTNKTFAHGIPDWHTIKSYTVLIQEDSLNFAIGVNSWFGTDIAFYARFDSLNCSVTTGASATSIKNDSVFFRFVYTDFNR